MFQRPTKLHEPVGRVQFGVFEKFASAYSFQIAREKSCGYLLIVYLKKISDKQLIVCFYFAFRGSHAPPSRNRLVQTFIQLFVLCFWNYHLNFELDVVALSKPDRHFVCIGNHTISSAIWNN